MKGYLSVAVVIILILVVTIGRIVHVETIVKKERKHVIDSLINEIRYHRWKDSIYWIHISKCSFISNDQIKIKSGNRVEIIPASKTIK